MREKERPGRQSERGVGNPPNWEKMDQLSRAVMRCEEAAGDLRRELKYVGDQWVKILALRRKDKKRGRKGNKR